MKIGLDLDGVLYDWCRAVYIELTIYHKLDEEYNHFWAETYKDYGKGIFWDNFVRLEHLYGCIPPSRKEMEMLNRIAEKHEIYYITARPKEVTLATEFFLKRHRFPYKENLQFSPRKDMSYIQNKLDVFFDDMPHHIDAINKVGRGILVKTVSNLYCCDSYENVS